MVSSSRFFSSRSGWRSSFSDTKPNATSARRRGDPLVEKPRAEFLLPRCAFAFYFHRAMRPIDEFQTIRDGLFFWQGYDPAVKTDLGCCALVVGGEELIFTDPLPLAHEPLEQLVSRFRPAGIVLTNANHE